MKYLYGDATESPLDLNYLEVLRDTLDFGASVMLAHGNITQHRERATVLQSEAKVEREQLELVNDDVDKTLAASKKKVTTRVPRACVDAIRAVAAAEIKRADAALQAALAKELGEIHDAVSREQANNVRRLEALLLKHDLPECALWVNARFDAKQEKYLVELIGKAACDVAFVMDLDVPPDHLLAEPLRVDRIAPGLTIRVPEKSGWVRKSVKLRPHKLIKEYVVSVSHSTKRTTVKLRNALSEADAGYDLIFGTKGRVAVARLSKGAESEPFEPEVEDKKALLTFYDELNRALNGLKHQRRALRGAQLDATPLAEHADATVLVRRLVQQMAPVVHEIALHSLSPEELVLKRVLADDRREEIFLAKADLRAKLEPLAPELRAVFTPLALDVPVRDLTGPPPPVRAGRTQVMASPDLEEVVKHAPPAASPRPPAITIPEPAAQRPESRAPLASEPILLVEDEQTSVHDRSAPGLPALDSLDTGDEGLPPLQPSLEPTVDAMPEPPRHTLQPGAQGGGPPPLPPPPGPKGVSMPARKRPAPRRSAQPPPGPTRPALPRPSSRGAPNEAAEPKRSFDIHASDSVDIQLDELLKPSE